MRTAIVIAMVALLTLVGGGAAEARIFEPQADWWTSGRLCVASREPAGRRWRAVPPRSCAPERGEIEASHNGRVMSRDAPKVKRKRPTAGLSI